MNIIEDHDFMNLEDALYWAQYSFSMDKVLTALGIDRTGLHDTPDALPSGFSPADEDVFFSAKLFSSKLAPFRRQEHVTVERDELGPGVWLEARYFGTSRDSGVIFPNDSTSQRLLMLYRKDLDVSGAEILQAVATVIDGRPDELTAIGMLAEEEKPCRRLDGKCAGRCEDPRKVCISLDSFGTGGECYACKCRNPRRR